MKQLLKGLFGWIFKDEYATIRLLDEEVLALKQRSSSLNDEVTKLLEERAARQEETLALKSKIVDLSEPVVDKPDWLVNEMKYVPVRRFVSRDIDYEVKFENKCDVFDKSVMLSRLAEEMGWKDSLKVHLMQPQKAEQIRSWIANLIQYTPDKSDNWRPITETLIAKRGDCEDSAILLCSLLGLAGLPADKVFVACGWWKPGNKVFGHAYVVAELDYAWYVLDATQSDLKTRKWSDAKEYTADWGLVNWKFSGMIKDGGLRL